MPEQDQVVAVELAQLREQVKTVGENVSEIKSNMAALITLDKAIAELAIHSRQTQDNIRLLWERLESSAHDLTSARTHLSREIQDTDRKVEAWVNQARGASWAAGIILGIVQIAVVASVAWVFTNVTEVKERSSIHEVKIERLEVKK